MIKLAICLLCAALFCSRAEASQMQSKKMNGFTIISIDGDIVNGDAAQFRKIAIGTSGNVVVALNSDGGSVVEALDIAKAIKLLGYGTVALDGYSCNSACAFIWLAGEKRGLQRHARVGFHASYLDTEAGAQESGVANALVGQFFSSLNLSQAAIIFATEAAPSRLNYLTVDNAASVGISIDIIESENAQAKAPQSSDDVVPSWVHGIAANGWKLNGYSDSKDILMFTRSPLGRSPTGFPRLWVRFENEKPDNNGHLSSKALEEYNCSTGQFRTYDMILYSQNNLEGDPTVLSPDASSWSNIAPDSMAETEFHLACH